MEFRSFRVKVWRYVLLFLFVIYVFGVADVSGKKSKLLVYGYFEDQGGKGRNNVASLLMKALQDHGWLIKDSCDGRLSIVLDSFGGQNKNKMVLRLALYLIEMNYFKKGKHFLLEVIKKCD